jgi:hypothetical protein
VVPGSAKAAIVPPNVAPRGEPRAVGRHGQGDGARRPEGRADGRVGEAHPLDAHVLGDDVGGGAVRRDDDPPAPAAERHRSGGKRELVGRAVVEAQGAVLVSETSRREPSGVTATEST